MKYQAGDYVAVHQTPIWRDRANFLFHMLIGNDDGKNEWEQLWWQQVAPQKFVLCCIPFFIYGLALGDEVEMDSNNVFQAVRKPSGQVTFRVWLGDQSAKARDGIVSRIEAMNPLMEWSSENLLALSVPEADAQQLADHLQSLEGQKLLQYETGRR